MPLYALEDLDDALAATRALLWPIDRTRWVKLALVALFVAGPGANLNVAQYNVPANGGGGGPPIGGPGFPGFGPNALVVVAAVVGVVVALALAVLLIGSIMEFVLVESLRAESVTIRRYWSRRWRQGLRLFGFRLVVALLVLGSVLVVLAVVVLPVVLGGPGVGVPAAGATLLALVLLVPILFVLATVVGLIEGFTTVFVVPVMVLEGGGVLAGWRRLWPTITRNPWQYLAYAIVSVVLSILGGVLVAVAVGVGALVLLIPFGLLGAIGVLVTTTAPSIGIGVLVVVGLLFGLSVLALAALAQVPVVAYLRYYALLVLGDVHPDLDLIPDRRAAIRADGGEGDDGNGTEDGRERGGDGDTDETNDGDAETDDGNAETDDGDGR